MMRDQDDPRLTAAALEETLEKGTEIPAFSDDPAASAEVEEIANLANLLRDGFAAECRQPLPVRADPPVVVAFPLWARSEFWAGAVAAVLTVAGIAGLWMLSEANPGRSAAPVAAIPPDSAVESGLRVRLDAHLFNQGHPGEVEVRGSLPRSNAALAHRMHPRPHPHVDLFPALPVISGPPLSLEGSPEPAALAGTSGASGFSDAFFEPYAAFPLGVGEAGYLAAMQHLRQGQTPDPELVRVEEFVNAFYYDVESYRDQLVAGPLRVAAGSAPCPWNRGHRLVQVVAEADAQGSMDRVSLLIDFNPAEVSRYRLLGSGQISQDEAPGKGEAAWSGDQVVAMYEIVPLSGEWPQAAGRRGKDLRQGGPESSRSEMMRVSVEWDGGGARQPSLRTLTVPLGDGGWQESEGDFRFAAAVSSFCLRYRGEDGARDLEWSQIRDWARAAIGPNPVERRREFVELIERSPLFKG